MGLRQKSLGIRLGPWEYIALILVGCTLASALACWRARNGNGWEETQARVVGLSLAENNRPISAARPQLNIHFAYAVEGNTYRGVARLDTLTRSISDAVPARVIELVESKGYLSFADLPPDVQAALRRRGIERLDAVPDPVLDTLRAQGFVSVRDFPRDVRQLDAPEGTGAGVAAGGPASQTAIAPGIPMDVDVGSVLSVHIESVVPVVAGATIRLLYDTGYPARHRIARLPQLRGPIWPALLAVCAILTVLYCGAFYPWVKQR